MLLQRRIYEWSKTLPPWQQDLMRRLTAGPLDEAAELEVLKILAATSDAPQIVPLELADLPADEAEHGRVDLRAVRDLRNITCLAPGQELTFESGLNAVFGDNGSGKSGYGRLIRRVTRSGEPEEVLRDVFDPGSGGGAQTAAFDIAVDGAPETVSIDLAYDPERILSVMEVFDTSRANVSLAKPNVIEHVPRPLRLLRRLSSTQDRLVEHLREREHQRRAALPLLPEIGLDTAAGKKLHDLNGESDVSALVEAARLDDFERARLDELETAAAVIRADQSQQLEAAARTQAVACRSAMRALTDVDAKLTSQFAGELADMRRRLDDVNAAERQLAERAFSDQRFEATGQGAWREMFLAAERFAQASHRPFPDATACPLCQQDLDDAARRRMQNFKEFVGSDLRQKAIDLSGVLNRKLADLPDVDALRVRLRAELRGSPDEVLACADDALAILDARADQARRSAAGEPTHSSESPLALDALRSFAEAREADVERRAHLRDGDAQRAVMVELGEMRARVAIVDAEQAIAKHVADLRAIARIEDAVSRLNTQKVNLKLRELQEAAITDRLRRAVEEELRELDPLVGKVEVTGKASKGETVIQLKLKEPCRAKVGNVLSEGEQRALALAFFLAEVATSDGRSAIILDDPVSSLDHKRRDYLARRLVEECKRRQVIVFTHDMAFMYLLQEAAANAEVALHGQTLERAFHRVGMVADGLPAKMRGTAKQIKALGHQLRSKLLPMQKRQDPLYEQEADRWVADLRKAYDQLIEDTVLAGTVRRFNAHVRVRQLHEVKWTPQVAKRIDQAMRKASPKSHHEPLELHPAAHTPQDLTAMLDELETLYREMGGKPETVLGAVAEPADISPVVRAAQPSA